MPKAKTLDRLKLTRQKMIMREAQYQGHGLMTEVTAENVEQVQNEILAMAEAKEKSAFLKLVEEIKKENPKLAKDDAYTCPLCGGELTRYEGCYRCKKCSWSKC